MLTKPENAKKLDVPTNSAQKYEKAKYDWINLNDWIYYEGSD